MSNNNPPVQQQQVRININLDTLEEVTCPNCNCTIFETSLSLFKKLPVIQSPIGKSQLIKVDLVNCYGCGKLFQVKGDELQPVELSEE